MARGAETQWKMILIKGSQGGVASRISGARKGIFPEWGGTETRRVIHESKETKTLS